MANHANPDQSTPAPALASALAEQPPATRQHRIGRAIEMLTSPPPDRG